jgi:SnoaL-like domain
LGGPTRIQFTKGQKRNTVSDHPYLDIIRIYYIGCSTGNAELMKSTFMPDITHYFISMEPVHGADTLANFWLKDNEGDRRTVWTVDHAMVEDDEAVIEWTMVEAYLDERPQKITRGAEWYKFINGKISEIRAYYRWVDEPEASELIGFPYAERGYPTFDNQPKGEN